MKNKNPSENIPDIVNKNKQITTKKEFDKSIELLGEKLNKLNVKHSITPDMFDSDNKPAILPKIWKP